MCSREEIGILVYDRARVKEIARKRRRKESTRGTKKKQQTTTTLDPFY